MKKLQRTLVLLSAATLMMLGSCDAGGNNNSVNPGESTSNTAGEQAYPLVIKKKTIPYLEEGVKFDFDKYVSIEMSDGTENHDYTISCSRSEVVIEGHKVKCDTIGQYFITVEAGSLLSRITITVLSNEQIKMINFLSNLEDEPNNFTIDAYEPNGEYFRTYAHNSDYALAYDKTDLGKTFEDGESASFAMAYLNDGNGYLGYLDEAGQLVFEPGIIKTLNWYYLMIGMMPDASDSYYDFYEGEDHLFFGPSFTENLLAYGCSMPMPAIYPGEVEYAHTVLTELKDTGMDGNPDEATFKVFLTEGTRTEEFVTLKLYDIGTTSVPFMETAIKSDAYIPTRITGDEIATAFGAIQAAGNYTVTASIWSVDASGAHDKDTPYMPTTTQEMAGDAAINLYGSYDTVITSKVTANGVYSEYKQKKLEQQGAGVYVFDTNYSVVDAAAIWNDANDSKCYKTKLDAEGALPAATEITGETNVFQIQGVKDMTAGAVTLASVNETNWTKKKVDDAAHTVTFAGDVGSNDGTTSDNGLFKELLNMLGSGEYGVGNGIGEFWTKAEKSTSGGMFALGEYSDYSAFVVNTVTNEIDVTLAMYAPFSDIDSNSFIIKFTISDIGTTSYDFNSIKGGVANVGLLAA